MSEYQEDDTLNVDSNAETNLNVVNINMGISNDNNYNNNNNNNNDDPKKNNFSGDNVGSSHSNDNDTFLQLQEDIHDYFTLREQLKRSSEGLGALRKSFKETETKILEHLVREGVTSVQCTKGTKLLVKKVMRKKAVNRAIISDVLREVVADSTQIMGILDRMESRREKKQSYALSALEDKRLKDEAD